MKLSLEKNDLKCGDKVAVIKKIDFSKRNIDLLDYGICGKKEVPNIKNPNTLSTRLHMMYKTPITTIMLENGGKVYESEYLCFPVLQFEKLTNNRFIIK